MLQAHRWALLGNAVSVPVAAWLGQCLANPFRHKYYLGSKDRKFITTDPRVPQGERVSCVSDDSRCLSSVHLAMKWVVHGVTAYNHTVQRASIAD